MFINLSSHPSSQWGDKQTQAAKAFGRIIDMDFPRVDPYGDESYLETLAEEYVQKVLDMGNPSETTVHLMGEMTLTFALVKRLQEKGVTCLASTTEREVVDYPNGQQKSIFVFVKFRKYQ